MRRVREPGTDTLAASKRLGDLATKERERGGRGGQEQHEVPCVTRAREGKGLHMLLSLYPFPSRFPFLSSNCLVPFQPLLPHTAFLPISLSSPIFFSFVLLSLFFQSTPLVSLFSFFSPLSTHTGNNNLGIRIKEMHLCLLFWDGNEKIPKKNYP